jgi:hypothetical protein
MQGSGTYTASAISRRALPFNYPGTYSFAVTPSTVTLGTPLVEIKGTVNSYFVAGCNVSFSAAYVPLK